jgi:hypothetical protein
LLGEPVHPAQFKGAVPAVSHERVTTLPASVGCWHAPTMGVPAALTGAQLIVGDCPVETAHRLGLVAGAAVLAAEELGLAQRCLEITVAYLKERRQFARPLGSFQALKRRRSAKRGRRPGTRAPAWPTATRNACSGPAAPASPWGHPAHLYLRRAEASSVLCGTRARTAPPWRAW